MSGLWLCHRCVNHSLMEEEELALCCYPGNRPFREPFLSTGMKNPNSSHSSGARYLPSATPHSACRVGDDHVSLTLTVHELMGLGREGYRRTCLASRLTYNGLTHMWRSHLQYQLSKLTSVSLLYMGQTLSENPCTYNPTRESDV